MITALDTNVLVTLWDKDDQFNSSAYNALSKADSLGQIVICGAVYAELLAFRDRTSDFVDRFIEDSAIRVDWEIGETIWRTAGEGFAAYAKRRRKHGSGFPRRILTDFLIGAHALSNEYTLLTLDKGTYKTSFPKLRVIGI